MREVQLPPGARLLCRQSNRVDEDIQCDMSCWQDAELERPPESSLEGSRNEKGEKSRPLASS